MSIGRRPVIKFTSPEYIRRSRELRPFLSAGSVCIISIAPSESERKLFRMAWKLSDAIDAMERDDVNIAAPVIALEGFNDDPRELWHIPEARQLLATIVSSGLLSVMEPSVIFSKRYMLPGIVTMGALEAWLIASDRFDCDAYQVEIDPKAVDEFAEKVLPHANHRLFSRIARLRRRNGGAK